MTGAPVHVVTVNDYLARRDAEAMGPIYRALGLTVGLVEASHPLEKRQKAYAADIVYVTNKELVFDYMRDRLDGVRTSGVRNALRGLSDPRRKQPRLRGLGWAIVDEADSVLIDEARTPLIIGSETSDAIASDELRIALSDVKPLMRDIDFSASAARRQVRISDAAIERVSQIAEGRSGAWRIPSWREELWRQALVALHLRRRDVDYIVRDGRIEIIDEFTGRVMPGRSWGAGLQELVELKEGCRRTARNLDVAKLTYQRFFRRYPYLSGLTGTATETSYELWSIYRLCVARLRTRLPSRRVALGPAIVGSDGNGRLSLRRRRASMRPAIGTRTLAASVAVSDALQRARLSYRLLNAAQDQAEAEISPGPDKAGRSQSQRIWLAGAPISLWAPTSLRLADCTSSSPNFTNRDGSTASSWDVARVTAIPEAIG
jgi:preprotein translocase subunit SecA